MKNTLNLILIALTTFFLFACDSSSSAANKKVTGTSYFLSVKVSGLKGSLKMINGNDISDILDFKTVTDGSNAEKKFNNKVSTGTGYLVSILKDSQTGGQACNLSSNKKGNMAADVVVNVTCGTGGGGGLTGNLTNGETYYMSECAVCHQAGTTDPTKAFGSSDVAENYRIAKNNNGTNINSDMHAIGANRNLMGRFDSIPAQSVADLEVYLLSVTP